MSNISYDAIRICMKHREKSLARLPEDPHPSPFAVMETGSGGVFMNRAAVETLIDLINGTGDHVVVNREWFRRQLLNIGCQAGQADLLLDNAGAPIPVGIPANNVVPFTDPAA